jgi:hypothetical protein
MIMPQWVYRQAAEIRKKGINGRGEEFDKVVATTLCRIEPQEGIIRKADGNTEIKSAKGWFPYGVPIERGDHVISEGQEYKVLKVMHMPTLVGYSHKEVDLGD